MLTTETCVCGIQKNIELQCIGCGSACGTLTAAQGTFSDGSGPLNYSNNAYCEWLIAPLGAVEVTIQFAMFSTQPVNDTVRVVQCSDVNCSQQQELSKLSGMYNSSQVVQSETGYMKVIFTTDNTSTYDGFTATWSSVSLASRLILVYMAHCIGLSDQLTMHKNK